MKTRAELIETLSYLQVERIDGDGLPMSDTFRDKKYWKYHDSNCKLLTPTLKQRIKTELKWKIGISKKHIKMIEDGLIESLRREQHGTQTKV